MIKKVYGVQGLIAQNLDGPGQSFVQYSESCFGASDFRVLCGDLLNVGTSLQQGHPFSSRCSFTRTLHPKSLRGVLNPPQTPNPPL